MCKRSSIFFYILSFLFNIRPIKVLCFKGSRKYNIYLLDLDDVSIYGTKYMFIMNEDSWLWNLRLGDVHSDLINRISFKNLVVSLPNINIVKDKFCDACQMGKKIRVFLKPKNIISTLKVLEFLQLD